MLFWTLKAMIIVVLLASLVKMSLQNYYKMLIWLKKVKHYKNGQRNFDVWQYWYWKKINFTVKRLLFFWVDIEKVLVPKKIYFNERNYKDFIGYLYKSSKRLIFKLLIINKYYTTNSIKPFFSLLVFNKY